MSVESRGGPTTWWRGQGGCAALWCGQSTGPLLVSLGLRDLPGKIGTLGFVASTSENISNTTFLKPKQQKTGTGPLASCQYVSPRK